MNNLISILDNRMNPIVVKELRQGLQSWFIIIIVNLLLVALSLVCLLTVMTNPNITEEATGGRDMFMALEAILFFATIVCVPLYTLARLRSERNGMNVDLFFITTLQPHKIIRGKFIAGMSLVTLLHSICLPFMLFTYVLRGYDIPTMLFTLAIGYASTIPLLMAAITLGTWTVPRMFSPFVTIAAFFALLPAARSLCVLCFEGILPEGVQNLFRREEMIWVSGLIASIGFLVTKLLEAMAIGLLSPPSSNRTCRLRIWMTITILAMAAGTAGFGVYMTSHYGHWESICLFFTFSWSMAALSLVTIMVIIAICEPGRFSNRIMIQRPRHFVIRLICLPFTCGTSSGLFWIVIHAAIIFGCLFTANYIFDQSGTPSMGDIDNAKEIMPWIILVFSCILTYSLMAKVVMWTCFRRVPAKHTWVAFLFIFMLFLVVPMVTCFAIDPQHWDEQMFWKIFNPMAETTGNDTEYRAWVDAFLALTMLAICTPKGIIDAIRYLFEKQKPLKLKKADK